MLKLQVMYTIGQFLNVEPGAIKDLVLSCHGWSQTIVECILKGSLQFGFKQILSKNERAMRPAGCIRLMAVEAGSYAVRSQGLL